MKPYSKMSAAEKRIELRVAEMSGRLGYLRGQHVNPYTWIGSDALHKAWRLDYESEQILNYEL